MIKVFGHKAPDTDTICSAIAYAWILNRKGKSASAYRLGNLNKETEYVLKKFGVKIPPILPDLKSDDEVVIVDTNNPEELPENVNETKIITIIDHHKLTGGLKTSEPIPIIIKPLASTGTIVWKYIKHSDHKIDKGIAGILLAAILSDTLNLTSPTTTPKDKDSTKELSEITGVDPDKLAPEMFEAKSDLSGMSVEEILAVDSKVFNFSGINTRVSVLETTNPQKALKLKSKLISSMEEIKKSENLGLIFFFVIDILKSEATLIVSADKESDYAKKAFDKKFEGGTMKLPGVVSRKKQIVPSLEKAIK